MVRTAKPHQLLAAGVVAGQAHGLHHCLGAGHVERHLVHARGFAQALHVVHHDRVVCAQHRTQVARDGSAFVNALFVKVIAHQVHAIGAGQVDEHIAVQIGHGDAGRRLQKGTDLQALLDHGLELVGHAVSADELHVRQAIDHRSPCLQGFGVTLCNALHQRGKRRFTLCHHLRGGAVYGENLLLVVAVVGQQRSQQTRIPRMACQRAVLGQRELGARLQFAQSRYGRRRSHAGQQQGLQF